MTSGRRSKHQHQAAMNVVQLRIDHGPAIEVPEHPVAPVAIGPDGEPVNVLPTLHHLDDAFAHDGTPMFSRDALERCFYDVDPRWHRIPGVVQRMLVWTGMHDAWFDPREDPAEARAERIVAWSVVIIVAIIAMSIIGIALRTGAQSL